MLHQLHEGLQGVSQDLPRTAGTEQRARGGWGQVPPAPTGRWEVHIGGHIRKKQKCRQVSTRMKRTESENVGQEMRPSLGHPRSQGRGSCTVSGKLRYHSTTIAHTILSKPKPPQIPPRAFKKRALCCVILGSTSR